MTVLTTSATCLYLKPHQSVHNIPAYYLQVYFNITLPIPAVSCHHVPPQKPMCTSLLTHVPHAQPLSLLSSTKHDTGRYDVTRSVPHAGMPSPSQFLTSVCRHTVSSSRRYAVTQSVPHSTAFSRRHKSAVTAHYRYHVT